MEETAFTCYKYGETERPADHSRDALYICMDAYSWN